LTVHYLAITIMEEDLEINDPRVEFLAEYVLKTMKLRADRWLKMYSAEENKQLCLDFFDKVCTPFVSLRS